MWLTECLFTLTFAPLATCTPIGPTSHVAGGGGGHLITGVAWRDVNGHVPIRREIRDLKNYFPDQWNLYLLGLRYFQMLDQDDPLSFYRIAGIHGKPYQAWEGAEGLPDKVGSRGYCPHRNALFLSWHRPYLALYEQELYKHIQAVAMRAPSELFQRYKAAADSFRIPYWDWALGEKGGSVPEFFLTPTIQVMGTDGVEQTLPNPLYQYEFHPLMPGEFEGKWAAMNTTVRWPLSNATNAQSHSDRFVREFEKHRRGLLEGVSQGFSRYKSLNAFSTEKIEDVHGWVHGIIGGNDDHEEKAGHMWPVEYSAFEPLFMLHHANVDRLFALWQDVHPGLYMEPSNIGDKGTVTIADNTVVDVTTPLSPFWKDLDTFWTTNDIRDTTVLGYAYPETQFWNFELDAEYRASINATIAQLYSSSVRSRLATEKGGTGGDLSRLTSNGTFVDWSINVKASSLALPPTFQVRFSLIGHFSSDEVADVGVWTILMPMNHNKKARIAHQAEQKGKCASSSEKNLKGSVSLTASLLDQIAAGKLENLEETAVVSYLKEKLTWTVVTGDGAMMRSDELGGLAVEVVSSTAHIPDDPNQVVKYSDDITMHPEVTSDKGGGVNG